MFYYNWYYSQDLYICIITYINDLYAIQFTLTNHSQIARYNANEESFLDSPIPSL